MSSEIPLVLEVFIDHLLQNVFFHVPSKNSANLGEGAYQVRNDLVANCVELLK